MTVDRGADQDTRSDIEEPGAGVDGVVAGKGCCEARRRGVESAAQVYLGVPEADLYVGAGRHRRLRDIVEGGAEDDRHADSSVGPISGRLNQLRLRFIIAHEYRRTVLRQRLRARVLSRAPDQLPRLCSRARGRDAA